MNIKVLLFAYLKEQVNQSVLEFELDEGSTLSHLKQSLESSYPVLEQSISDCRFAVNHEYSNNLNQVLKNYDEVALIPPVSGG